MHLRLLLLLHRSAGAAVLWPCHLLALLRAEVHSTAAGAAPELLPRWAAGGSAACTPLRQNLLCRRGCSWRSLPFSGGAAVPVGAATILLLLITQAGTLLLQQQVN